MRDEVTPSGFSDEGARPGAGDPAVANSPLAFVLRAIWQWRVLVALIVISGTGIGLFLGIIRPNEFESVGKLLIKPGVREALTPEVALSGGDGGRAFQSLEALSNELQILADPKLYQKVVEDLGVDALLTPYDPTSADGPDTNWVVRLLHELQASWFSSQADYSDQAQTPQDLEWLAATMLAENVLISPVGNSTVLTVSYLAHSPERAQIVVDAVLRAALEVHSEAFETETSLVVLEEELKLAEQEAQDAEMKLATFRQEHDIYDLPGQRGTLIKAIDELNRQIESDAVELTGKSAELTHLEHVVEQAIDDQSITALANIFENPEYIALQAYRRQLQLLELELPALTTTLSPAVKGQRQDQLRKLLEEAESQLRTLEEMPAKTDVTRRLELDNMAVQITGIDNRRKTRVQIRNEKEARLVELGKLEAPLTDLEREAKKKKDALDRLISSGDNLAQIQRLDKLNVSNLRILTKAEWSPMKIGPNRMKFLVLGSVVASILAVLMAVIRSLLDPRIYHPVELAALDIPIHSTLGESKKVARARSQLPPALYSTFRDVEAEIVELWARLPLDRRMRESLTIGFVTDIVSRDTTAVAGIAALGIAALGGESVVYVSCQRSPWLLGRLNLKTADGWGEVIEGTVELNQALVQVHGLPNLKILPVGQPADNVPPFTGPEFEALLQTLANRFRYVLVDVPSFAERPESRVLLQIIDAAEIVLRAGRSTMDGARDAVRTVRDAGATVSGIVVVRRSKSYK